MRELLYEAGQTEHFPICGMNESTYSYLMAVLLYNKGNSNDALHFIMKVLGNREISKNLRNMAENQLNEMRRGVKKSL